jgi:hypothetical protein
MKTVRLGKWTAQLIPRVGVHIYRLGVGPPPHTRPNKPTHTAHGPNTQMTLIKTSAISKREKRHPSFATGTLHESWVNEQ